MTAKRLTLKERKQIFRDLVIRQDRGAAVQDSYQAVIQRHRISEEQLRRIEEEGIANDWPPLRGAPGGLSEHSGPD